MIHKERIKTLKNTLIVLSAAPLIISSGCGKSYVTSSASEIRFGNFGDSIFGEVSSDSFDALTDFESDLQSSEIVSGEDKNISVQSKKEDKSENSGTAAKPSTVNSGISAEPSVEKENSNPTQNESPDAEIKRTTAADTRDVADNVIFYLNKARAEIGSGELTKLSGLTSYAEYRSGQLISNFAHDPNDWNKAAEATGYGKYIDLSEIGGAQQGYYDIGASEALAMAGIVGSSDRIAETLAQIIIDSKSHWSYVGSEDMKYTGVGVSCDADMWYAAILVTNTTEYEN